MHRPRPGPRRRVLITLSVTVVALITLVQGTIASADTASDQREVKRKRAEVASQVDTLQANDSQLEQALADLAANVRATQAQMSDAQAEADAAEARAEQAETQAAATEARIEQLRSDVIDAAVNAYVDPQADKSLDTFREVSASDATKKQAYIEATTGAKLDVVDEYRAAKQSLEDQRNEAEAARAKAQQRRDALASTKTSLDTALSQQQAVANQVSERLNEKLAESQSLASLDSQLSNQLANEQAALAARLREARSSGAGGGAGGGGGGGGTTPVPARPGLSTVRGITVASSIAGQLASLLDAASSAGYELGGSGYRDSSGQIALRRENCGTSDYAIYQMPPEQCSPATAIPGRSKHEQGLAIDFTIGGHTLRSSDGAYGWMMANAGRFGFVNLPGEPWHFSAGGG
jgi:peptidoglycan hydrolase CwlO-like protein